MQKLYWTISALLVAGFICLLQAQAQLPLSHAGKGAPGGGGGGGCSAATTWLAAVTTAHTTDYTTLICNLVTSGVWAKLDVINVYATDSTTNALLNMKNTAAFNSTSNGAVTFTADQGYTGVAASSTAYIEAAYNPSTAGGNLTASSMHFSVWSNTSTQALSTGGGAMGVSSSGSGTTYIIPYYSDGNAYYPPNDTDNVSPEKATNTDGKGHYLSVRTGTGASTAAYKNAASQTVTSRTGTNPLPNANVDFLVRVIAGVRGLGFGGQLMAVTIGGALNATEVTSLCHELNTYLASVSGISSGTC